MMYFHPLWTIDAGPASKRATTSHSSITAGYFIHVENIAGRARTDQQPRSYDSTPVDRSRIADVTSHNSDSNIGGAVLGFAIGPFCNYQGASCQSVLSLSNLHYLEIDSCNQVIYHGELWVCGCGIVSPTATKREVSLFGKSLSLWGCRTDTPVQQEQLERFFEGASNACGRRGTRSALTILFQCCARNEEGGYACESRSGINRQTCRAHAGEVLHLGYALALATAYLAPNEKKVSGDDDKDDDKDEDEDQQEIEPVIESVDPQDFLPQFGDSNDTINNTKLHALSKSLVEFSKGRDGLTSPYQSSHDTSNKAGDINSDLVSLDVFLEWAESVAPLISATLSTFMHYILFPDVPHSPTRTSFFFPSLRNQASAFFNAPNSPLLFTFACMSNSLGGKWHRLYTSDSDGLSFNRLQNSLLGYGGPTLLIIRETLGGGVFGAFTAHAWKESKDFYGNSDCFLFQLLPACAVYRPSGNGRAYMYCNSEARSKGYDRLSHGIGFGGNSDQPRLFISECFDGCTASSQDLTFERGVLLPRGPDGNLRKRFDIESLEVWGVGGDDMVAGALGARDRQREIVAANIRKARKVDKAQFLDDFQSGLIESKAFQHRDQIRGRATDACIDDMDAKNYKYKK
eukprot:scaffold421259_cov45-Attheya_sp.AAC.6